MVSFEKPMKYLRRYVGEIVRATRNLSASLNDLSAK